MDAGSSQGRQDAQPIQFSRQHAVKNDGIILARHGFEQPRSAIGGYFDGTAIVDQRSFDFGRCPDIILDYKNCRHVTSMKTPN